MILSLRLEVKAVPTRLPYGRLKYHSVRFRTPAGNASNVYLSDSPVSVSDAGFRYALPASSFEEIQVNQLDPLWYYGGVEGDYLYLFAEVIKTPTPKTNIEGNIKSSIAGHLLIEEPESFPKP